MQPCGKVCRGLAQCIGPEALQATLVIVNSPPGFGHALPALLMLPHRSERRPVGQRRLLCASAGARARARVPWRPCIGELITQKIAEVLRRLRCRGGGTADGAVDKALRGSLEALGRV